MPVSYSSPDLLAVISAVYICDCGKRVSESGRHAGELPPDWVAAGDDRYLCAHCAARAGPVPVRDAPGSST